MDHLIKLVHKNPMGLKKLVSTFQRHWSLHKMAANGTTPSKDGGLSKHHLEQKITSIAHKEPGNKSVWQVSPAVLHQYGFTSNMVTPLTPLGSPERRNNNRGSLGKKPAVTIQQFFTPTSHKVARCLSLSPPAKKPCNRHCEATPTVIDITQDDESCKATPITAETTPIIEKFATDDDKENTVVINTSSGIDWTTHLVNRHKIVVPIDVHTGQDINN